ncbi:hypothetical protein CCY99_06825, partial [Helicobacter sp. 16-1353]|uniref:FkbM family methyltransferase n=1 Tax=Helicobacter sp. 16-1353 TaxID=2004996 RepID=UPI000DCBBBC0
FFDIGAYKGESSLEFIKHNKNYKQIYFFEPERKNFNEARENLKDFKHIKGFNIGLGDKKERLMVNSISTSSHLQKVDSPHSMDFMEEADSMDSAQKHYIEVNSLDNLIASGEIILNENILNGGGQQVMLKIDIESSEEFALKGASKLIRDYKPIIAICIYHRFDDFINLPNIIFSIYEDYKLYFRHYSSGLTESVMFFVPKSEV